MKLQFHCTIQKNNLSEARTNVNQALNAAFRRNNLLVLLISLFLFSQNSYAKSIASDPVERGIKKYEKGDFSGALAEFNAAIAANSKDLEALDNRAMLYFQLGQAKKAFADLNRAIKFYPRDDYSYSKRGEFRRLTGDLAGSLADYLKAVSINPQSEVALTGKARTEIESLSYKNAEIDLKKAKALSPKDFEIQFLLISFMRKELNDEKGAKLLYTRMRKFTARSADDHFWLGNAHCIWDEPKLAEQEFTRSIELDPYSNKPYYNRAAIKNEFGDKQGAMLDLNKAIDLSKGDAKAYFNRSLLRRELGDPTGADADFQRALELDPKIQKNNSHMLNRFIVQLNDFFAENPHTATPEFYENQSARAPCRELLVAKA
jgi:tetratricopeptide (TPR) repeat protein